MLTPYTAYLVLETEKDYIAHKIDRRQRHRYWEDEAQPGDAPPGKWLTLEREDRDRRRKQAFAAGLIAVRRSFDRQRVADARSQLSRLHVFPEAQQSPELDKLQAELDGQDKQARQQRSEFTRRRDPLEMVTAGTDGALEPNLSQLLGRDISPELTARFPLIRNMMSDVGTNRHWDQWRDARGNPVEPTLEEFARRLSAGTGLRVEIDIKGLEETTVAFDTLFDNVRLFGNGPLSWHSFTKFVLRPAELDVIEEDGVLLIAPIEKYESAMKTKIYPVADLLLADHRPERGLLSDPLLDCQLAAEQIIKERLQRPISLNFKNEPLEKVAAQLADQLGINIAVDMRNLPDSGNPPILPITLHCDAVPAKEVLRTMLRKEELDTIVENEALMITTRERADAALRLRLHPAAGLIVESSAPPPAKPRVGSAGSQGVMMGGIGGGMGGGVGGGGGTFGGGGFHSWTEQTQVAGAQLENEAAPAVRLDVFHADPLDPFQPDRSNDHRPAPDEVAEATPTQPAELSGPPGGAMGGFLSPRAKQRPDLRRFNYESVIDMVTTLTAPTTWDSVGGPGSVVFFEPSLDLIVNQTAEVHEQIDDLFARLRQLPLVGLLPDQRVPQQGHGATVTTAPGYLNRLIDLITTICLPTTWDDVGGPKSIMANNERIALIVTQDANGHESINQLLTLLRRSRAGYPAGLPLSAATRRFDQPLAESLDTYVRRPRCAPVPQHPMNWHCSRCAARVAWERCAGRPTCRAACCPWK